MLHLPLIKEIMLKLGNKKDDVDKKKIFFCYDVNSTHGSVDVKKQGGMTRQLSGVQRSTGQRSKYAIEYCILDILWFEFFIRPFEKWLYYAVAMAVHPSKIYQEIYYMEQHMGFIYHK